jgi:hypothetical protein
MTLAASSGEGFVLPHVVTFDKKRRGITNCEILQTYLLKRYNRKRTSFVCARLLPIISGSKSRDLEWMSGTCATVIDRDGRGD